MNHYVIDLFEILTKQDGEFNSDVGAYVTAYPINEETLVVELEYVDAENDNEVIEVKSFTVRVEEN